MEGSQDIIKLQSPSSQEKYDAAAMLKPAPKTVAPSQVAKRNQFPASEKPRNRFFEFGSREDVWRERRGFLYACALCKMKISQGKDVYMYGTLQAFCSKQCRDDQITLDEKFNPPSKLTKQSTENVLKQNVLRVQYFNKYAT